MAPDGIEHLVITDRDDLDLFRRLEHDRMHLVTKEEMLPGHVRRLQLSKQIWLSTAFPPVRGWIAQQIIKIQAAATSTRPYLLFADSDVAFLKPFEMDRFTRDGLIGLSRVPYESEELAAWRRSSAGLLHVDGPLRLASTNYVSNLIPWRRDIAKQMTEQIESDRWWSWITSVALRPHFSEYTLYGVYCDEVVGLTEAGHFSWDDSILNLCWQPVLDRAAMLDVIGRTTDEQIGVMLHSKSRFEFEDLSDAVRSFWNEGSPR